MPRTHIVQSWTGAAEYDEGDTYSGEQIGNRRQKSVGIHIIRDGDNWKANINAYADKPKTKPQEPLHWRINPKQKALDLIDQQEQELENAVMSGRISLDDYRELVYALLQRRETAYRDYLKSIGELDDYDMEMKAQYGPQEHEQTSFLARIHFEFVYIIAIIGAFIVIVRI